MSHANVKIGRGAFNSNAHGQQLLIDINDKMRIDLDQIKTNTSNIQVNVDNVNLNTDTLETKMESIDSRLDSTIGHINNLSNLGSGSDVRKCASLGVMPSGNARILSCDVDGKLNVDNSHFSKITTLDTRFDNTIGAINNLSNLGSGSNALKTASLGVMPSGNARILSCDVDGKLNVDNSNFSKITTIDSKLDSYAGGGDNNIGESSTKLQIFNYGRDVSAGNYKPMVVNSNAEQIIALSSVDNAVLDAIATDGDNIQTKLDTIDTVLDNILVQNTASEDHLSNIDSLSRINIATGASQLADSEKVGPENCSKFSEISVIYLTTTSTSGKKIFISGSTSSGGTYYPFAQMSLIELRADSVAATDQYLYVSGDSDNNSQFIPCIYPFIKIQNDTGTDLSDTDDIRIVGR